MPETTPNPVSVKVTALGAATLPLSGAEVALVFQEGEAKQTPVSSIGGTPSFYARPGTHTPVITPNDGTTAVGAGAWLWTRIGSGAGVPAVGDVVKLSGKVNASRVTPGEGSFTFTLPFVPDFASGTAVGLIHVFPALSGLAYIASAVGTVTLADLEGGTVQLEITYQTANAVDP